MVESSNERREITMKKVLTAFVVTGVMMMTGSAFANEMKRPPAPRDFRDDRPPMSRDIRREKQRPPMPPDGKHHRVSPDRRPPMPSRSFDKRPPEIKHEEPGVAPRW